MKKLSMIGFVCAFVICSQISLATLIDRGGPDMYGNAVLLEPSGQTNYTTNFGNSVDESKSELYSAVGVSNSTGKGYVDWVKSGEINVGAPNWQYGGIAYHFHSDAGFAGGTVSLRYNFRGSSDYVYWTIGTQAPTSDNGWQKFTTISGPKHYFDVHWGAGTATLAIPAGNDVYIEIDKPGNNKSEYIVCYQLDFNPTFVPEPATIGLIAIGAFSFIRRRR